MNLLVSIDDQVQGILFERPFFWYEKRFRIQPAGTLHVTDVITLSENDFLAEIERIGFDRLSHPHVAPNLLNYLKWGGDFSIYSKDGTWTFSFTERGNENVFGRYETLQEAKGAFARFMYDYAVRKVNYGITEYNKQKFPATLN